MEYYSAIKKEELLVSATTTWVDLDGIVPSGVSQTENGKCHFAISLTCGI